VRTPQTDSTLVVGPGSRFLSGIGYHTASIIRAFSQEGHPVSAILIRQLCPSAVYPGRDRIGQHPIDVLGLPDVSYHEGLDWYMARSLPRALAYLAEARPKVVLLQWWTAATAHNYLMIARAAKRHGASVVLEAHEAGDVGENAIPLMRRYTRRMVAALRPYLDGLVVHSADDATMMIQAYPAIRGLPIEVIFPGPLAHAGRSGSVATRQRRRDEPVRFLNFGVVRPYKGIDELATAFSRLAADENVHLTVAGEPWPDSKQSLERIRRLGTSRSTVIDRFLEDEEIPGLFEEADVVVLPYHRASASGPVNLTMEKGLPLVTTTVSALREACTRYDGVDFALPADVTSLEAAMRRSLTRVGQRFANPHSWNENVAHYLHLFDQLPARAS
jgi:glycosyltransferase involved in cell wall biosynthesis